MFVSACVLTCVYVHGCVPVFLRKAAAGSNHSRHVDGAHVARERAVLELFMNMCQAQCMQVTAEQN